MDDELRHKSQRSRLICLALFKRRYAGTSICTDIHISHPRSRVGVLINYIPTFLPLTIYMIPMHEQTFRLKLSPLSSPFIIGFPPNGE